jgi:2-polyprenyl-6-methoxyphenol hydroxylase-like FAD-dependent oxidoreductase
MMLGYLLARSGVKVCVLEKHADFLRDFRGDTVHASTLELVYELGLLEEFLKRPHQKIEHISGKIGNDTISIADFTHLPTHCKFVALMPQWEFLNFLCERAQRFPAFEVRMQTEATDLLVENGRVVGVQANSPEGPIQIHAELTVGADGRKSIMRNHAGLRVENLGAPMDVLWMRISRHAEDPGQAFGRFDAGKILVLIDRGDYWQMAYVVPKGSAEQMRQKGIENLRQQIAEAMPFLKDRVRELHDWDEQVKLLTVAVDRLRQWSRPGLLCIGDAAHAMSPIGGVGINLAIQDAVAAANVLVRAFQRGIPGDSTLQAVQERREFPTRVTQGMQIILQNNIIRRVLSGNQPVSAPWPLKLLNAVPLLQRVPARLIGLGARPEHVHTKAA